MEALVFVHLFRSISDFSTSAFYLLLKSMFNYLMAQTVKNLPTMQETWVQSLGGEDPLEEEMAVHSSILAWRLLWTEEPGGLQSLGLQSGI